MAGVKALELLGVSRSYVSYIVARNWSAPIAAAISEIERLPQAGQDALSDWTARARTRADAKSALDDLSQSINSM